MIPIAAGTYCQGSPATEPGRKGDEGPTTQVEIRPFWMGKCEVTWNEYELYYMSDEAKYEPKTRDVFRFPFKSLNGDAITRPSAPYTDPTYGYGRDGYPAINMSHHAAMEYCRWLSAKTGVHYRLPTEAEWEYACRAGTATAYHFGDDVTKLGDYAWFYANSQEKPHPVGSKKPNPWGLHDMHGNVAEWCLDGYVSNIYDKRSKDAITRQPVHLQLTARFPHVVRGGSWVHDPKDCRCAARLASDKSWLKQDPETPQSIWYLTDADFVGFRIVRADREQNELKNIKSNITRSSPFQPE